MSGPAQSNPRLPAPRASRLVRLAVAAGMWTVVGTGLGAAGLRLLALAGGSWWWYVVALAVGVLKARFALARRARANARRIADSPERSCVFGAFSWPMWLLVAFFMALGATLRRAGLPHAWLGALYLAVGVALVAASGVAWRLWARARRERQAPA